MRSTTRAATLVLAALLAAHCGGTDDSEADSTQPTVETTSTTSAPTTTTSAAPTTTSPPTTTTAPPTTTSAVPAGSPEDDVAVVEALVTAWYGNDLETVSQLLDPLWSPADEATWTPDDIRQQMEYTSALESRVESLICYLPGARGESFWCQYYVGTLVTDAIGLSGDSLPETLMEQVAVIDGRVVNWVHDDHGYPNDGIADYLVETEQVDAVAAWQDGGCIPEEPRPLGEACVEMLVQHLDGYVEWFAEYG